MSPALQVPKWVSPVLHQGNFVALVADLVVSRDQRSFSSNAAYITAAVDIVYCSFCFTTRQINGSYPYAFMCVPSVCFNQCSASFDFLGAQHWSAVHPVSTLPSSLHAGRSSRNHGESSSQGLCW